MASEFEPVRNIVSFSTASTRPFGSAISPTSYASLSNQQQQKYGQNQQTQQCIPPPVSATSISTTFPQPHWFSCASHQAGSQAANFCSLLFLLSHLASSNSSWNLFLSAADLQFSSPSCLSHPTRIFSSLGNNLHSLVAPAPHPGYAPSRLAAPHERPPLQTLRPPAMPDTQPSLLAGPPPPLQ